MAATRLLMRRLRELLRLKYDAGLSHRAIAQACAVGLGTVTTYLQRATAAGLTWPLPDDLDDATLEARVFARPAAARVRVVPEWGPLHQELKKPGVTLALLWQEYRAQAPDGYAYSQFCERYRRWARTLKPSMRQVHRAGEKLFVDFSGKRPHLVDPQTGEDVAVELFVGVLGASSLIYAEATRSQDLPSWIGAHVRMLDYFQGSPAIWVPDNLKSGVTTASRYEPEVNRTYADLARHYGAVVIPARVATPTDKPKVEVSVQIAQRWILAVLRHRTFFTLADLNAAIAEQVDAINERPMKITGVSRRALFDATRSARARAVAADALRARGMEAVSRQHRLPRRGRSQLLQRAVAARARTGRGAVHPGDRRTPLQGAVCRHASAAHRPGPVCHPGGAHAARASRARGMDAVAPDRVGRADRPGDRPARGGHPRAPPASRAGLPRVPRADAARAAARGGSSGSRLCAGRAAALLSVSHRRTHSHQSAGPVAARGSGPCTSGAVARESARRHLLRGGLC